MSIAHASLPLSAPPTAWVSVLGIDWKARTVLPTQIAAASAPLEHFAGLGAAAIREGVVADAGDDPSFIH